MGGEGGREGEEEGGNGGEGEEKFLATDLNSTVVVEARLKTVVYEIN